ncbi:TadE/TadG family type IV pilus assembly protein [Methylobacterium sp. JK268]
MRTIGRFLSDRAGVVALILSLSLPVIVAASGAAVEYARIHKRRAELQKAVDVAALGAAGELTVAGSDRYVEARAKSLAFQSANGTDPSQTRVTATIGSGGSTVTVAINETMQSLFGRLLTLPSMEIGASATAELSGSTRICLLTLDDSRPDGMHLHKNATLAATSCGMFGNSTDKGGVHIENGASVDAALVCSAGGIAIGRASVRGVTQSGCPVRTDPLASRSGPAIPSCTTTTPTVIDGSKTPTALLTPGIYCKGLKITNGAVVTFAAGIYIIDDGPLTVDKNASISGQNVGFYFTGDAGGVLFDVKSSIDLTAPKDGVMAGLLFFENRSVSAPVAAVSTEKYTPPPPPPPGSPPMRQYRIISNNARNLLGTIYLPAGRLIVDAGNPVADRSAYTIIVARQVEFFDGPSIYLNSNYGVSDIPVPDGVGNTVKRTVRLVQ